MKNNFIILSFGLLFLSLFISSKTFSQTIEADFSSLFDSNTGLPVGITEQISTEQIPKVPKPGEKVSIRITSYMTNLNKAKITWSQDGKVIFSEMGAVTAEFQAPDSGKKTTIVATIVKENGGTVSKTFILNPADVDLIYEASTYSHPFYKGKNLFTSESVVTVIAVPNFTNSNGTKIPASNLVYTWKINGTVDRNISGYGKDRFITKGQLIERPVQVSVDVSAINSTLLATNSITLKSTSPDVVMYENNPILGVVYEKAILGSFLLERSQVDFEAIPYFFSVNTKNDFNLKYKWTINGVTIQDKAQNENYVLLQNNTNEEGTANISVTAEHLNNIVQNVRTGLQLNFKKANNTDNEEFNF